MSWKLTDTTRGIVRAASSVRASVVAVTRTLFSPRRQAQLAGVPFQWRIPADADLAERVRVDLYTLPTEHAIEVHVERGRVSLRGTVHREVREVAVEKARSVSGVRFVEDLLVCDSPAAQ